MNNYKLINNIYKTFDENLNLVDGQSLGTIRQTDNLSTILTVYVPSIDDASDSCYLSITLPVDYPTKIRIPKTIPELFEYSHRENDVSYYKCSFKLDSRIAKYPGQVKINLVILHDTGDYKTVESADGEKVPVEIVLTRNSEPMLLNVLQSSNYYVLDLSTEEEQEEALEILSALTKEYASLPLKYLEKEKGIIKLDALPEDLTGYKNKVIFSLNDKKMFLVNNHLELIDLFVNKEYVDKLDIHPKIIDISINGDGLPSPSSLSQEDLNLMNKDPRNIAFFLPMRYASFLTLETSAEIISDNIYTKVQFGMQSNKDYDYTVMRLFVNKTTGALTYKEEPLLLEKFKQTENAQTLTQEEKEKVLGFENAKLDKLQARTPEYNFNQGVYANNGEKDFLKYYTSNVFGDSLVERKPDGSIKFATTDPNNGEQGVNIDFLNKELEKVKSNYQGQIDALNAAQNLSDMVRTNRDLIDYDTSKLFENDKIQVLNDEVHENASTVYRWTGVNFEYIGKYGQDSYTKTESDNKYVTKEENAGKLDKQRNLDYGIYGYRITGGDQLFAYSFYPVANTLVFRNELSAIEANTNELDNKSLVNIEYFNSKQIKYIDLGAATTGTLTDEQFALLQENHKNYIKTHFYDYYADYYYFNTHNDGTIYYFNAITGNAEKIELHFIRINPNTKAYTYFSRACYVASTIDELIENTLELPLDTKYLTDEEYNRIVANPNSIIILIDTVMFRCVRETASNYIFVAIFMGNANESKFMSNHVLTINKTTKQVIREYYETISRNYVHKEIEKHLVIDASVRPIILSSEDYNTIVDNINSITIYIEQIKYRFVKESDVSYQFSANYIDSHEVMHVYRISINKKTHEVLTLWERVITKKYFDQEYTKLIKQFTKLKKENYIHELNSLNDLKKYVLMGNSIIASFTKTVTLLLAEKTYKYKKHFTGEEVFGPYDHFKSEATLLNLKELLDFIFFARSTDAPLHITIDSNKAWILKDSHNITTANNEIYLENLLKEIDPDITIDANRINNTIRNSICIHCTSNMQESIFDYFSVYDTFTYQIKRALFKSRKDNKADLGWNLSEWIKYIVKPVTNYSLTVGTPKDITKYIAGTYGIKLVFKILYHNNKLDDFYLFIKMDEVRLK